MREKLKKYFSDSTSDGFYLYEHSTIEIYIGIDEKGRKTLVFRGLPTMSKVESTLEIESKILSYEKDFTLIFSLVENVYDDIFLHFCEDLLRYVEKLEKDKETTKKIINRYNKWRNLLAKQKSGILSENIIKGLICELIFMKEVLFKEFGDARTLFSWTGDNYCSKDFVYEKNWFEVKCVSKHSATVEISSLEQLDSEIEGQMILYYLEKVSELTEEKVTINIMYQIVLNSLSTESLRDLFKNKMLNLGYIFLEEYEQYCYIITKVEKYRIDSTFPSLKRKDIPEEIIDINYKISLGGIRDFMI